MARRRKYGEDLTYAEWHRNMLADMYQRRGHRLDMADRDWTEVCHFCREPLGIAEEVIDRGQDLRDKATTITRNMAKRANVPALLIAPRMNRPPEVQQRIDQLNTEIRELEAAHPITRFTVKRLWPHPTELETFWPDEFAAEIYLLHRDHHARCWKANQADPVTNVAALRSAQARSRIWLHWQPRLELNEATHH